MIAPLALAVQIGAQRPIAVSVRTDVPPAIDGRLDDEAWSRARPIGPLTQVEPEQGVPASEATEIRFLHDERRLYVAIRCLDREPAAILGTQMSRDAQLDPDDRVEIVLDTFRDRRNAFFFQINPVGSQGDALLGNNGAFFNKPWDGIWEGRASIDEGGWSAELAIPFATLSFDPSIDTWGMNVVRHVKRRNEVDRWASPRQDVQIFHVAEAGDLAGLTGLRQGIGLDVVPFFHGDWTRERSGDPDEDLLGKGGFDAFYRLTPNLTATLTVNTDFAETEVDERRINLTRFPLFFPEKRDFFLENAGIFQFANLGGGFGGTDLLPFFSRRIGLDAAGGEVPILFGGKLTGRAGDWNLGLLDVQTAEHSGVPERNLFVSRISRNVGEQSSVGGIVTAGNPGGTQGNHLLGLDWNYRTSRYRGDKNLTASAWAMRTGTEGEAGDDLAFGASLGFPNDLWNWTLSFREVQEDFDPKLGFVTRTGVRTWFGRVEYEPRLHTSIRQLSFATDAFVITDLSDRVLTADSRTRVLGIEWESGDELRFDLRPAYDRLDAPFDIQDGVTIPADSYSWLRGRVSFESAQKRPVSGEIAVETGGFYDGERADLEAEIAWRPSRFFTGGAGYERSDVDLPGGAFTTHVGRLRANVSFSPDLDWLSFVQFDNESDSIGLNSRLRWIVKPGEEFFLVVNDVHERRGGALVPLFEEVAFKIVYTLRF